MVQRKAVYIKEEDLSGVWYSKFIPDRGQKKSWINWRGMIDFGYGDTRRQFFRKIKLK
tara:strand:- start:1285 stop:1458 length:174 start_codon:yes stop_codon:yes gene_type:complete